MSEFKPAMAGGAAILAARELLDIVIAGDVKNADLSVWKHKLKAATDTTVSHDNAVLHNDGTVIGNETWLNDPCVERSTASMLNTVKVALSVEHPDAGATKFVTSGIQFPPYDFYPNRILRDQLGMNAERHDSFKDDVARTFKTFYKYERGTFVAPQTKLETINGIGDATWLNETPAYVYSNADLDVTLVVLANSSAQYIPVIDYVATHGLQGQPTQGR